MGIYIKDWLAIHPYEKQRGSDLYYMKLAKKLLAIYEKEKAFEPETCEELALLTAAYFEDVISGFGLWRAFTTLHKAHFGKLLPFYPIDEREYLEDEVNEADVRCLIWMVVQRNEIMERPRVINPENPGLTGLATRIYALLDAEFEQAPINNFLEEYFPTMAQETDFVAFREQVLNLFFKSYLLTPFNREQFEMELDDFQEELEREDIEEDDVPLFEYDFINNYIFTAAVAPLALPMYEWLNALVPDNRDNGRWFESGRSAYQIIRVGTDTIEVESVDGGLAMVRKDSFDASYGFSKGNCFSAVLIRHRDQFNLNGMMMSLSKQNLVDMQADISEKRTDFRLLNERFLSKQESRLIYGEDLQAVNVRFSEMMDLLEPTALPETEGGSAVVGFLHPVKGFIAFEDMASAISDPMNPFYDAAQGPEHSLRLLLGISGGDGELIKYLIGRGWLEGMQLNSLLGEEHGKWLAQDNLEFMFRFFQPEWFREG